MTKNLPDNLKAVYQIWQNGYDLKKVIFSRTYIRYVKEFKEYNIDITIPFEDSDETEEVLND